MRTSNWFILKDYDEYSDNSGYNETFYILRFENEINIDTLQENISEFMRLYADYDALDLVELSEERKKEINDDLDNLKKCSCQFDYTILKLQDLYKDMEIETYETDKVCVWY